jgi:arylsulfatase A-like enzyme
LTRRPNVVLVGIDSLRADRTSALGGRRLTTPHLDAFAHEGTLFQRCYSPHIPTTPAYASMLTGRDAFGTGIVALRQEDPPLSPTLAQLLREHGYTSTCIGFTGNAAAHGFDSYLDYPEVWGPRAEGYLPDGSRARGSLRKAENLVAVTRPELERLAAGPEPFFLFLRPMDPHTPYLPPPPFDRLFYAGDELDPANRSLEPVRAFAPFWSYFESWLPQGLTDIEYVIAQYDGAAAYLDACLAGLFGELRRLGILDDTIVVVNADHGETLDEHECWFDHHGLYDVTLHVPLLIRYPARMPAGRRIGGYVTHKDLVPTLLELAAIEYEPDAFEGRSLLRIVDGGVTSFEQELYLTECTWMRKHGWRTPAWKLIVALEPDFHFKPPVELYDLVHDPGELHNLADERPDVVEHLRARLEEHVAARERATGRTNPMLTQGDWHGHVGVGPFTSSEHAYEVMRIGSVTAAQELQEGAEPA